MRWQILTQYFLKSIGNPKNEFTIEVHDHAKRSDHLKVGEVVTTLEHLLELGKNEGSLQLKNKEGKKQGELIVEFCTIEVGPSMLREITGGLKQNVIWGIDCAKIDSNTNLKDREEWLSRLTQIFVDKLDFMFHDGKIQFFGMNGKCSTDNLFTNTVMDLFPLSGDIEKNSFHYSQINTPFFQRNLKNFLNNTEGSNVCTLSKFIRFCADHSGETNNIAKNVFTVAQIFFWHVPNDLNEVRLF